MASSELALVEYLVLVFSYNFLKIKFLAIHTFFDVFITDCSGRLLLTARIVIGANVYLSHAYFLVAPFSQLSLICDIGTSMPHFIPLLG